ncbi:Dna-directed Rna polymerase II RPBABC8 [Cardiosporidium cionae]|uniref:DNA-directed RNA polymerases I, II, and III subunit RPABC3 n=1 Tax=Cardiosporidium cionae TaxID=476202 RepID=A0ABQ7J437_9APIC|nr:Dna-directed Rna polymerase II RPBABC8 [Cardiosporidium cionae]|eukprot:KAF8817838.1 Dna-directed Rna polymerase II RPBABC8 [Cardiosporidium cionae]
MVLAVLFEDRMEISSTDSSKFERISRLRGKSTAFDAEIELDINSDLFPVTNQENLYICLSNDILQQKRSDIQHWDRSTQLPVLDDFDYCMFGKIFKMEEPSSERRTVFASFGGLMMALTADKQVLADLEIDMRIYLLIKRVVVLFA